jgi:uncharacterized RDD family membrane protein YckC
MLRTKAEFSSSLPYDGVERDGEFVRWPGSTVASALAKMLERQGCTVEPLVEDGEHGWWFSFRFGSAEVVCNVTVIDGILAQFDGSSGGTPLLGKRRPPNPDFVEILERLDRVLRADERFADLGWFGGDEVCSDQVGASTPTGPYDPAPCFRRFGDESSGAREPGSPDLVDDADSDEAADEPPDVVSSPHPMRRWAGRMLDRALISWALVGGVLLLCARSLPPHPARTVVAVATFPFVLPVLRGLAAAPPTAFLLSRTSTSPGKWLCGLQVVHPAGRRLRFGACLKRELDVLVSGCGVFLPWCKWFVWGGCALALLQGRSMTWDERAETVVQDRPDGRRPIKSISLLLALWAALEISSAYAVWALVDGG